MNNPDTRQPQPTLILIVDDRPENLQVLGSVLMNAGYEVMAANGGEAALAMAASRAPELILLDVNMPPGIDGFETSRRLKDMPGLCDVPVIFLTARTETEDIVRGFEAGGVDYVTKPFNAIELLARIRNHLELRAARLALQKYAAQLEQEIRGRRYAEGELRKLSSVVEQTDDIIFITDVDGAIEYVNPAFVNVTGYSAGEVMGQSPSILNSSQHKPGFFDQMWDTIRGGEIFRDVVANQGKDGRLIYVQKTITPIRDPDGSVVSFASIDKDVTQWRCAQERIEYMALHDNLTGLANRVKLMDRLQHAITSVERRGTGFALLFIDLDGFKPVNDTLGHDAGDYALREVAARYTASVRENDTVARVGGDEFVILLEDAALAEDATGIADKLLQRTREPLTINGTECQLGASIGIALYPAHGQDADTLLKNADDAMYLAKAQGKNRFCVSGQQHAGHAGS